MQFSNNIYGSMDNMNGSEFYPSDTPADLDEEGQPIMSDDSLNFTMREIGVSANPMQSPLEALKARVRDGASKIEFEFMQGGKGNSQNPTPESMGRDERRDIRELLRINEMTASTHAAVLAQSLAGFDQRSGFYSEARDTALKEIKRAIHFAGEATTGGAIVFHAHEWNRPLSEVKDSEGKEFKLHEQENKQATFYAVDAQTGRLIEELRKDDVVYRPVFKTAKDLGLTGKKDSNGNTFYENDWVDRRGNKVDRYSATPDQLLERIPIYEDEKFKTERIKWSDLETERQEKMQRTGKDESIEEMRARIKIDNTIMQQRGNQLYHTQDYSKRREYFEKLKKQKELFEQLKKNIPEKDHWKLEADFKTKLQFGDDSNKDLDTLFKNELASQEKQMRYMEEIGTSYETQIKELQEKFSKVSSVEKYGLEQTADTISRAAMYAMETYEKNKDKHELKNPLYVAPENWHSGFYGSHPDELKKIVEESRKTMTKRLRAKGYSEQEAKEKAKTHIKATLDVGHLNTLREHFQGSNEDFEDWMVKQTEKLVKEGIVGHVHLSDNFGFDDEHLTPGQGNVPMKRLLKKMQEHGLKDIIVEVGSYNAQTSLPDTMAYLNSPIHGISRRQRASNVRHGHIGYNAPGFFIAGAYSPSNDWKPWTDLPLE